MRVFLLLVVMACGQSQKPILANAPHPDNAAVAGGAAAAAAAMTLADPDAATRGKPERSQEPPEKTPIEVKEHVTPDVLDRLDEKRATPQDKPKDTPAPAAKPASKALPKLPSPKEAAEKEENGK
jgi:hypothetical protein